MSVQQIIERDVYGTSTFDVLERKYGTATIGADDMAVEYGSHPTQVRKLCREGVIRGAVKIGDRWRIPLRAAAAFLDGEVGG